jgi:hypothetical protein
MAVVKKKDIDWRYYLKELVQSTTKISELERLEFAGFLLKRDMKESFNRHAIFEKIVTYDNCYLADVISSFLTVESPDSLYDLLDTIKKIVLEYYNEQIMKLIEIECKHLKAEKSLEIKNHSEETLPSIGVATCL